jgi:hypothetical protein
MLAQARTPYARRRGFRFVGMSWGAAIAIVLAEAPTCWHAELLESPDARRGVYRS